MRTLWTGLVDDAAVFPPGSAPLPRAVALHRAHRRSPYASLVGPLLVPAAEVAGLVPLAGSEPLEVVVVGRPGTPLADVRDAVEESGGTTVRVVGVEVGWTPTWRESGLPPTLPTVLEVPRGEDHVRALDDVAAAAAGGRPVVAKLRTGPTATWAWPDEAELATWLVEAADRGLPFKLTGGLHHAVRGRYVPAGGAEEDNHGVLNVLVATHASRDGSGADHVRRVLEVRDGRDLADLVHGWDKEAVALTRSALRAYGCCTVTDPIDELTRLGLLEGLA